MTASTSFAPAATTTIMPDVQTAQFAMPTPDGANTDTQITATSWATWISFGSRAGPDVAGSVQLSPGVPVLLTNVAATLAACASNPNVIGGTPATVAATSTSFSALAMMRGGSVTVTRGTASPRTVF